MEVAKASMYDGSTAAAEEVLMAHRLTGRNRAVLSGHLHPHYAETVRTMAGLAGDIVPRPGAAGGADDPVPHIGGPRDLRPIPDAVHGKGARLVAAAHEQRSLGGGEI